MNNAETGMVSALDIVTSLPTLQAMHFTKISASHKSNADTV